jgi:hypothetical protein
MSYMAYGLLKFEVAHPEFFKGGGGGRLTLWIYNCYIYF